MIKNNFKIAWRNLRKNRLYTAIHILGLSAGISFALLITAYVWQEFQVNKNLKNTEQQYLLTSQWKDPNMGADFTTLGPVAEKLRDDYPHLVANYYRWDGITGIITTENKNFREQIQLGDESLLDMFGFDLVDGNAKTAFENPFSVVLTSGKAIKLFGKTDVVGETIAIQNFEGESHPFKITGVLDRISENSVNHVNKGDACGVFIGKNTGEYFHRGDFQNWNTSIYVSYIQLQPGVTGADLQLPLKEILTHNTTEEIQKNLKILPVKLTDYYFDKNNGTVKRMLYTMSFVGLFIVLMAMINFVNIAVSHSSSRMREIGIRKVLGGERKQLIFQFLTESITLTAIATVLACAAYPFLRPWFSELIGKDLPALLELPNWFLLIPLSLIVVIGALAGLYPAFVLSAFKSIDALKGKMKSDPNGFVFRKALVGFQFLTALVVLISALVIAQQVNYFFGKNLGYDKDCVITAQLPRDWTPEGVAKMETVRDVFKKIPSVKNVSLSYEIPNGNNGFQIPVYKAGGNPNQAVAALGFVCDEYFLTTYQIPLLAGSFFNENETNPNHIVINKKALEPYGFKNPEDAIGQQLKIIGQDEPLTISGVAANFHFESMQEAIKPQVFFSVNTIPNYRYLSFKLGASSINKSITAIRDEWANLLPESTFEFNFMDETLQSLYAGEIQFKKAANTATILALIIALLGIFGLVTLNINKRAKEVGIRKVLGASAGNISFLFVREFIIVLGVSTVLACPLVYWLMQQWLENYQYRITIGIDPFLIAIGLIGGLTILLILLQTLKISYQNPTNVLRKE